jgi:hypothetical protein
MAYRDRESLQLTEGSEASTPLDYELDTTGIAQINLDEVLIETKGNGRYDKLNSLTNIVLIASSTFIF